VFWYDGQEGPHLEYAALNSTYLAEFNRINENFPNGCSEPVAPGTLAVVTSQKPHSTELAQAALADCWRPFGLHPKLVAEESMANGNEPYTLTMLRVEPNASSLPPPGDVFKSIPLEQVQVGAPGVALRRTQDGVEVDTVPGLGAFAARAKLGLDSTLGAKLVVLVRVRVIQGKIAVGLLDAQSKGYSVSQMVWPLPQALDVVLPLPSPPVAGDLLICNARQDQGISKFVVQTIEIRKLP